MTVPVITLDGPSASGKGSVASLVASRLGFHYLDSGSLYRLVALLALRRGVALDDAAALASLALTLPVRFTGGRIVAEGDDVSDALRAEEVGNGASKVGALPEVRAALLERQRAFAVEPGLVTDGRDMGSVVFPDAALKVFLTADAAVRADRRYKQLIGKGESANLAQITQDIIERDARDAARAVAPLRQEPDAMLLDTSAMTIDEAVDQVAQWYASRRSSGL
ncbi:(d)CMP kinase [Paludibacterium paludis]|uniref:Cytidylate kinase n=1 Tax=Paludibacterium paludis TaxID=1225769 RepID=A0A918U894_9NEIS|nr:(d)CMP kinase [Paludibacterium paludis]GGY10622.1 cytidylate kinase [Paludibacterium paludis]